MRTITALVALLLCSGCATLERAIDDALDDDPDYPYLERASGPNVWVRVPKGLVDGLQEAIDVSADWAMEYCDMENTDRGTYFVAADTAIMDESEYQVTWRCCRLGDECCFKPKSKACE